MPEPTAIPFSVVQRPGSGGVGLPAALTAAIEKTVASGQAIRIDTASWTQSRNNRVYRALHTYGKQTPFTVHRRRTPDCIYVWATRK